MINTWIKMMILLGPQFKALLPILLEMYDTIVSNMETKLAKGKKLGRAKAAGSDPDEFKKLTDACVENCACSEQEAKELCSTLPVESA